MPASLSYYTIERSDGVHGFVQLAGNYPPIPRSFDDTTSPASSPTGKWFYRLTLYADPDNMVIPYNDVSIGLPPPPPVVIDPASTNSLKILSWTQANPQPDQWEIWRAIVGDAFNGRTVAYTKIATQNGNVLNYVDHDLLFTNEMWFYKVRTATGTTFGDYYPEAALTRGYVPPNPDGSGLMTYPSLQLITNFWDMREFLYTNPGGISFAVLKRIIGDLYMPAGTIDQSQFGTAEFPELTSIGGNARFDNCPVWYLSVPKLASVGGDLNWDSAYFRPTDFQRGINLPSLVTIGAHFRLAWNAESNTGIYAPKLVSVGGNILGQGPGISSGMVYFRAVNFRLHNNQTINFNGHSLDQDSVDRMLAQAVASNVTGCTIDLSGGANAAPSGIGTTNKATLISQNNTVTTN